MQNSKPHFQMRGPRIPNSPLSPSSPSPQDGCSRDQERLLPIANVSRIMKKTLPANAKISKEAKETVQECVSEFISFVTGEASDKCQREKRKTVNGDDLLWAMTTLGFDDYVVPLKDYLSTYRESDGEREKNERVFRSSASASSPCEVDVDAEKMASNPSFLQGFGSGGGGGHGGVLIEFGGGRAMAEGSGVEW